MSKLIPTYIEQSLRIERLERELAEAQAEIVRLKGKIDELRAALAEPAIKDSLTFAKPVPEFELIEKWEGE